MTRRQVSSRRWWWLFGICLALAAAGAALSGCGSVADVGTGASRSGVQPVSGVYDYGSSGYTATDLQNQDKKVDSLARTNEKTDDKALAAAAKVTTAKPDQAADAAAAATPDATRELSPDLKAAAVQQEQGMAQAAPAPGGMGGRYGSGGYGSYGGSGAYGGY